MAAILFYRMDYRRWWLYVCYMIIFLDESIRLPRRIGIKNLIWPKKKNILIFGVSKKIVIYMQKMMKLNNHAKVLKIMTLNYPDVEFWNIWYRTSYALGMKNLNTLEYQRGTFIFRKWSWNDWNFYKSLDLQEDEFQLEQSRDLYEKLLVNFGESSSFPIYKRWCMN